MDSLVPPEKKRNKRIQGKKDKNGECCHHERMVKLFTHVLKFMPFLPVQFFLLAETCEGKWAFVK